ncbi:hypothetical protein C6Y14_10400 [Streptomyces dioscori]|uniref:Uncharacterized protein n=1 Tax=Streptomyces dioscori TaxID=2109333 RepID=A0A2P8QB79_9ACTN|nr:hypothetical protein [Streptomyces dioscori]PSM43515.1 hypothetical protein C6Y14_10400 [Streptomyces dioscori]
MPMRSCITCKSPEEEHRFLEPKEAAWLKKHLDLKNVDGFMVCLAPLDDGAKQCRNVRKYFVERPFREPLRLPEPE